MKELTLIVNIKSWIESLEDFVLYLPRKEMILKNRIWNSSFTLLEAMYEKDFQKAFSCISMLDYYTEYSYKKKYISHKACEKYLNKLLNIKKLSYGWKKYEENKLI